MKDSEGLHVVYCCAIGENNEAGVGIHWGNDIELALPVPPRPEVLFFKPYEAKLLLV